MLNNVLVIRKSESLSNAFIAPLRKSSSISSTSSAKQLQHFKFEPTGKSIEWNFAGVQYPSVGMGGPELPLKVSFLPP